MLIVLWYIASGKVTCNLDKNTSNLLSVDYFSRLEILEDIYKPTFKIFFQMILYPRNWVIQSYHIVCVYIWHTVMLYLIISFYFQMNLFLNMINHLLYNCLKIIIVNIDITNVNYSLIFIIGTFIIWWETTQIWCTAMLITK